MERPVWAVLPAAGVGRRMGAGIPKQYLSLHGRPVLHWAAAALLQSSHVQGAVFAVDPEDALWSVHRPVSDKPLEVVDGGAERFESVFNALRFLRLRQPDECRVLVHDAVRPCLAATELERLIDQGLASAAGALLAVPVRDTLKRQNSDRCVLATADRHDLWQAQTPQLFPLGLLFRALEQVIEQGLTVTDESQAVEAMGYRPLLVEGSVANLKITRPDDLPLAAAILRAREATPEPST